MKEVLCSCCIDGSSCEQIQTVLQLRNTAGTSIVQPTVLLLLFLPSAPPPIPPVSLLLNSCCCSSLLLQRWTRLLRFLGEVWMWNCSFLEALVRQSGSEVVVEPEGDIKILNDLLPRVDRNSVPTGQLLTCGSAADSPPSSYWPPDTGSGCILAQRGGSPLDSEEPLGRGYCGLPAETSMDVLISGFRNSR